MSSRFETKAEQRAYAMGRADSVRTFQTSLSAALDVVKADAWDEGFMNAAGQDHPDYPRKRLVDNPYRPVEAQPTTEDTEETP